VGCDVAPGFDFADFELCDRITLLGEHADHAELILKLTRENAPSE
jgi:predicted cupin superfamily sugar epimerase